MALRKMQPIFFGLILLAGLLGRTPSCFAVEQSIEFLPGYKVPDSASDGATSFDLRYFLHFPSAYLSAGVGVGRLDAPANHKNLAIGSRIKTTPIGITLRLTPPLSESFATFIEIGADHLSQLHYELDPAVDTGKHDLCFVDLSTGPGPCKTTAIKKKSYDYRFGVGIEKVFSSGIGIGLHYTYRVASPIRRIVTDTPAFGIIAPTTTREDLFELKQSTFSLLMSYHF